MDGEEETQHSNKRRKLEHKVSQKRKLDQNAYTIGWICVLKSELNAAHALLDEEHERLPSAKRDDNSYLLGRIKEHNIVITFTGSGTYGTNAAAQTATNLLRTFPNIRFGLMVGVGGGAPKQPDPKDPLNDIRLGDVVVSTPKGGHGGVLQYGKGKWKGEEQFSIESHLNKPPIILLKGVENLQSDHDFGEGRDQDQLFKADCHHVGREDYSECNATQVESRLDRESDDPVIHYGLIASGDAVMRSALRRNELRDAWGVSCFEMEATGLMDNFPCVVIQGICDYSDDHKNKLWQPYGAVVAAAYAKDLLRVVQTQDVNNMEAVAQMMKEVVETIIPIREDVAQIRARQRIDGETKVLNWLTPVDYSPQQTDYIGRRQQGTGQWLLDTTEYQTWLNANGQILFCPGIPGAGKTMLTSIVINDIHDRFRNDSTVGIAYIYCNFQRQEEQKIESLLANLLKQLVGSQASLPGSVRDLYSYHSTKRTRPSLDEILKTIQSITATFSKVIIVIDALDECQVLDSCRWRLLSALFNLQEGYRVNVFATSRFIPEIVDQFKSHVSLEIQASNEDIEKYIDNHIGQLPHFVQEHRQLQDEIKTGISGAASGMFLLAQIYLGLLDDKLTVNDIRGMLELFRRQEQGLGEDQKAKILEDAYEQNMKKINNQKKGLKDLAMKVLSWVTFAKRPLTTSELQHALATKAGKLEFDHGDLPHIRDMVSVCLGLVTIDEVSNIIRLVHYTTQEYLKQREKEWLPDTETEITRICATYLSFDVFETEFCETFGEYRWLLLSYPFYDYAANHWGHHARAISTTCLEVLQFLKSDVKAEVASQPLRLENLYLECSNGIPRQVTGLHLAAYFGVNNVVDALLGANAGPVATNVKDSKGGTLLSYAVSRGHKIVTGSLLEKGADPKSQDQFGHTPLLHAAGEGHEGIVRLLLEKDAELESRDCTGQTPLSFAAYRGHEGIVRLLLENGADPNSQDQCGETSLLYAACRGHEGLVRLLLENGADLKSQDCTGQTPLSFAAREGHEGVVRLLLENGADSKGLNGETVEQRTTKGETYPEMG
ncbi:hypothetical protein B7463_g11364, partial [Scytalidium lignicola]